MLQLRNVTLAMGVCTLICVLPLHADDPEKTQTVAAGQDQTKAEQPPNRLVDALLKLIDAVERDAKKADATSEEKLAAEQCQKARVPIRAGKFADARLLIYNDQPIRIGYQEVLYFGVETLVQHDETATQDKVRKKPYELVARETALYAKHQCNECLVGMKFVSYLAWSALIDYLDEPTCHPDALVVKQLSDIVDAERHRYPGKAAMLANVSEAFDKQLKTGELAGLGALVAQAMQQAPESALTERMKLRLILRLALRQPDFLKQSAHVHTLAQQFTTAARHRMALGEFDAARHLASDALPLNISIKGDVDSPSKVLADLESRLAITGLEGRSSNDATVEGRRDVRSSANLLLNSSFEDGKDSPDHWQQSQPLAGVTWKWDKETGFQSKSSVSLEKTAQRYFPIAEWYQTCKLVPDTSMIHVSAQVKAEKLTKGVFDVSFGDQAGQPLHHQWVAYIGEENDGPPLTHDWKLYEAKVAVPPGTKTCQVRLQIYGPGKVWFDDVSLVPVSNGAPTSGPSGSLLPGNTRAKPQPGSDDSISIKVYVSHVNVEELVARIKSDILSPDETDVTVESKIVDGKNVIALSGPERRVTQILVFITALDRPLKAADLTTRPTDPKDEEMNRKTEQLAKQVRESTGDEREKLKQDLERLVEQHFKQRQARRTKEIDDLARRVDQMREVQQKRQGNQAEILKRRVADLLKEDTGLEWNEAKSAVTPSVPSLAPTSAAPLLSQTGAVDKKADPVLEASNEPTFDGLTYSTWLKVLELDRNPQRVQDAVRALTEMPQEQDAGRLARGYFRFTRSLGDDNSNILLNLNEAHHLANAALKRLPAEPVVQELVNEIQKESKSSRSVIFVNYVLGPYKMPKEFKESMARHAPELIGALIESKGYPREHVFHLSLTILDYAKLRPRDIPGLVPLISQILKDQEAATDKDPLRVHPAMKSVARVDPEFPEVVEAAGKILNELRTAWQDLLTNPDSDSLVDLPFFGVPPPFRRPKKLQVCANLVECLLLLKSVQQESLPLLKEISATEWPKTKAFEPISQEALVDFKRIVNETIKSMEASIVSEQKP